MGSRSSLDGMNEMQHEPTLPWLVGHRLSKELLFFSFLVEIRYPVWREQGARDLWVEETVHGCLVPWVVAK